MGWQPSSTCYKHDQVSKRHQAILQNMNKTLSPHPLLECYVQERTTYISSSKNLGTVLIRLCNYASKKQSLHTADYVTVDHLAVKVKHKSASIGGYPPSLVLLVVPIPCPLFNGIFHGGKLWTASAGEKLHGQ